MRHVIVSVLASSLFACSAGPDSGEELDPEANLDTIGEGAICEDCGIGWAVTWRA